MENYFESAKTIKEKREILKQLSAPLKALLKTEAIDSINDGLKMIYANQGHTILKTLRQWNKEGKHVKKGEKALCLWGRPKQHEQEQETDEPTEEHDPLNFFPLCYVFSNLQVL